MEEAAEMAKLEAGEFQLHFEPVPVTTLVETSLQHLQKALGDREVVVKPADDLSPVRADLDRAKDILGQLIDNANLYSPKDTPITISADQAGDFVTFSVADSGPGIDSFEQGLIFDKFYRGRDQRYLGARNRHGIIDRQSHCNCARWQCHFVTSQLGHGSVFSFTLPAAARRELRSDEYSASILVSTTSRKFGEFCGQRYPSGATRFRSLYWRRRSSSWQAS